LDAYGHPFVFGKLATRFTYHGDRGAKEECGDCNTDDHIWPFAI